MVGRTRRVGRAARLLALAGIAGASTVGVAPLAGTAAAAGGIIVSEAVPWGNGGPSYNADWFELTNTSASAVDITGWRFDDNSNSFASSVALTGVTSIGPGESVVFIEGAASTAAAFVNAWFGGAAPAGFQIGTYTGSGISFGNGGDAVNIFDAGGSLRANITFGAATNFRSFDNAAGIDNGAVSTLATAGVNGAFAVVDNGTTTIASPGTLQASVAFGASPSASPFASFDNAAGLTGTISVLSAAGVNGAFSVADTVSSTTVTLVGSPGAVTNGSTPPTTGPTTSTTAAPATTVAPAAPWPGSATVANVSTYVFGGNLSGLAEDPSGVLWGVRNGPGALFRLVWNGTAWTPDSANGWSNGKLVHYPNGTGDADAEGVTFTGDGPAAGIYLSTERNNAANTVSRNTILRVDPTTTGTELTATAEWNLTADLPATGANLGLEAITWVPDAYLVAHGFRDTHLNKPYDPADYPNHGTGLFLVGVEATGAVHVYALDMAGTNFTRITSFPSGFPSVMDLQFDRDLQQLWAVCDNTCNGRHSVLTVDGSGAFAVAATFERPAGMPNLNNEGFAIAPQASCTDGRKAVWWADDGETGGVSLRSGDVPCTAVAVPGTEVPEFPVVVLPAVLALGGLVLLARRRRPVAAC